MSENIRRRTDGSVDVDHYMESGRTARSAAIREASTSAWRLCLAFLRAGPTRPVTAT